MVSKNAHWQPSAALGGKGLHTCPAGWLPESTDLADLRKSLRPALDLPVELILPSHGAPVLANAAHELAAVANG